MLSWISHLLHLIQNGTVVIAFETIFTPNDTTNINIYCKDHNEIGFQHNLEKHTKANCIVTPTTNMTISTTYRLWYLHLLLCESNSFPALLAFKMM